MLRRMTVDLSNFEKMTFGTYDGPWNQHPKKTLIFEDKADLLGIYGYGKVNDDSGFVDIVSLGFLANECPIRDLLEWERTYHSDKNPSSAVLMEIEREGKSVIALILVMAMLIITIFIATYCCLKNRGLMLKNDEDRRNAGRGIGLATNGVVKYSNEMKAMAIGSRD